ncbi:MAG: hypothetical protein EX272_04480 [Chromatiales bacterium]|nr:MAG: hypothetical protein EX272_04480 [Chromatiales bacterium]
MLLVSAAAADDLSTELGGHTKLRLVGQTFPDNSLYRDFAGATALDVTADLRLNLQLSSGRWTFDAAYQLVGLQGDSLEFTGGPPNDDRRLFNLSDVITDSSDSAILHRLDRLWIGYASEKAVVRLGRQALSWGNGLVYAPMDLVNPFDPTSIDTEYKAGDDMLYLQYLQDNGNDMQAAYVARRNLVSGDAESDEATAAVKYHGFVGAGEFDLLLAQSYGDAVVGVGASHAIGGAVWSADLVVTDTDSDTYVQFVTNLMYSWVFQDRNMSGAIEYYYNGFGQSGGRYDPLSLAGNPDLATRLARGELFTAGRHYAAANVTIEMTPLWTLTPTLLINARDPSALFQLVTNYSLSDNMTFLASLNIPLGANGSEFGGIDTGLPNRYLSVDAGLFAQFAWYF